MKGGRTPFIKREVAVMQFGEWLRTDLALGLSIGQFAVCAAALLLVFLWCVIFIPVYKYTDKAERGKKQ